VPLSLGSANTMFFDNKGTLWAIYDDQDPKKKGYFLFCYIDIGTGSVSPRWTAPGSLKGFEDQAVAFDYQSNTLYYCYGFSHNTVASLNVITGVQTMKAAPPAYAITFNSATGGLVGEWFANLTLASVNPATMAVTPLYPKAPAHATAMTVIFDSKNQIYVTHVGDAGDYDYMWWSYHIRTKKVSIEKTYFQYFGAVFCPYIP